MDPVDLFGLLPDEVRQRVEKFSLPRFRADQLLKWVFQRGCADWDSMSNIGPTDSAQLSQLFRLSQLRQVTTQDAGDHETTKFLFELSDGYRVESVLIRAPHRRTVCVSSQVGCPARCAFCASGRQGLLRNLTSAEITEQVWQIERWLSLREEHVSHIVYMGMGEPLANYDAVVQSIRCLTHPDLMGFSPRRITVSTVGVLEAIPQLAKEDLGVQLVLSLHAPTQELRQRIIPYARKVPLDLLLEAIWSYSRYTKRDPTFEYTLLAGINDQPEHAYALVKLLSNRRGAINLIPYNPVLGLRLQRPSINAIEEFRDILEQGGLIVTCRTTKGDDIAAACGQLALQPPATSLLSSQTRSSLPLANSIS